MKYFLIAGEASGDLHGSNLMQQLKVVDRDAQFEFLGGDKMEAVGGKMHIHYRQMAFMGFVAVIKNLKKIVGNLDICKKAIADFQPDVVIFIDYPSFNLRMAEYVKKSFPNISTFYYISPKIWAWKEFRIKAIKRYIDKMFTILPFETEFYKKHNYSVTYVGNPSIDSVCGRAFKDEKLADFCKRNGLEERPILALLPGSRVQEIEKCLPTLLQTAELFPQFQTVITAAPSLSREFYAPFLENSNAKLIENQTYETVNVATAAVVNSGTASLEVAIIGTPQVVVYNLPFSRLALFLKPYILKVKYISLVNLIAEKEVVKELIGHNMSVENLKNELTPLLENGTKRAEMLQDYRAVNDALGSEGTALRAATAIYNALK